MSIFRAATPLVIAMLAAPLAAGEANTQRTPPPRPAVQRPAPDLGNPPNVNGWTPGKEKLAPGTQIRISGSGFDAQQMQVRIGRTRLHIVSATTTLVVARAPHPNLDQDAYISGPLTISEGPGSVRTLHPAVRVVDAWRGFTPQATSVGRAGASSWHPDGERILQTMVVVAEDMPGDEFLGVNPGPAPDGGCAAVVQGNTGGGTLSDHRLAIPALLVSFPRGNGTRWSCRLSIPVRVRYGIAPGTVRVVNLPLGFVQVDLPPPPPSRSFTISSTWELRQHLKFTMPGVTQGAGTCSGSSFGTPVGLVQVGNDMALRIRSGPIGTSCPYEFEAFRRTNEHGTLLSTSFASPKPGWTITQLQWSESSTERCVVSRTGTPRDARPMKFTFARGVHFMGWEAVGSQALTSSGSLQVFLTCHATVIADHEAVARLQSVVIQGPATATDWREAFR